MTSPTVLFLVNTLLLGVLVGLPTFLFGIWIGRIIFNRRREALADSKNRHLELSARLKTLEAECEKIEARLYSR